MPTLESLTSLLLRDYCLEGELTRLPGENANYLLSTSDGRYVLKVTGDEFSGEFLEFEEQVVREVGASNLGLALPTIARTTRGAVFAECPPEGGEARRARLLEFVDGGSWLELGSSTPGLRRELGSMLARLGVALSSLDASRGERTHRWDLIGAGEHRSRIELVPDAGRRALLERAYHQHSALVMPRVESLPRQLIHGDVNHENLLVSGGHLVGLLDFGDCLVNPRVCELAIALAYVLMDGDSPLADGAEVVSAYHSVAPLFPEELAVLYPLICARLAVSVTISAARRAIDPDHPSWFDTEDAAWALLECLGGLDPADASNRLAEGTGLVPCPIEGASIKELLDRRGQRISQALSISYEEPLKVIRGEGQYLIDHRGRPFLDLVNNVCHVGHCHPRVVAAGQEQLALLNTNTRYLYDGLTDYGDQLCATLPDDLEVCFLVNSGSEANELALRLARAHTGNQDLLVVDGAYHGHTSGLIAISPYKFMGKGGTGVSEPWVHVVPIADGYRGLHRGQGLETGQAYGDEVGRVLQALGRPIAGFIAESLLGCGGQVIPPEGYFARAYEHVRAAGGVCIADEVQVGFGRIGSHFWAFESQGVVPDIVVMGKPIGNGHPMAAVVTTRSIADSFANGMEYFATFGGNPVSCRIGMAVLDVIEDERLQMRALKLGKRMKAGLEELMKTHELIGEVRGLGLFVGVEFVRSKRSLEPAQEEATEFVNRMQARGMLLSTDGPFGNVIKVKPPMVLSEADVDMFVRVFGDVLTDMTGQGSTSS